MYIQKDERMLFFEIQDYLKSRLKEIAYLLKFSHRQCCISTVLFLRCVCLDNMITAVLFTRWCSVFPRLFRRIVCQIGSTFQRELHFPDFRRTASRFSSSDCGEIFVRRKKEEGSQIVLGLTCWNLLFRFVNSFNVTKVNSPHEIKSISLQFLAHTFFTKKKIRKKQTVTRNKIFHHFDRILRCYE